MTSHSSQLSPLLSSTGVPGLNVTVTAAAALMPPFLCHQGALPLPVSVFTRGPPFIQGLIPEISHAWAARTSKTRCSRRCRQGPGLCSLRRSRKNVAAASAVDEPQCRLLWWAEGGTGIFGGGMSVTGVCAGGEKGGSRWAMPLLRICIRNGLTLGSRGLPDARGPPITPSLPAKTRRSGTDVFRPGLSPGTGHLFQEPWSFSGQSWTRGPRAWPLTGPGAGAPGPLSRRAERCLYGRHVESHDSVPVPLKRVESVCPEVHICPRPQRVTVFGKVGIKLRLHWTRVGPAPNDWVLVQRGEAARTHGERCRRRQRRSDAATSQGMPAAPRGWRRQEGPPPTPTPRASSGSSALPTPERHVRPKRRD